VYKLFKQLAFLLDAEKAHHLTTRLFAIATSIPIVSSLFTAPYKYESDKLHRSVFGLDFKNPVGLAAGFDKDGKYYESMSHLGFGFIEIGTVTPRPQKGNPKPRLFRLTKDESLINRMGFNNDGVDAMVERLKNRPKSDIIIGGNIGKNKTTPNDKAHEDYLICFDKLYKYVDYFVVNVSSPNTPGLRELQEKEPLTRLLSLLMDQRKTKNTEKPILLKIAPDLNHAQLDDIVDIIISTKLDGLIATNTTIDRSGLATAETEVEKIGNGGLSGRAMTDKATEVIRYIAQKSNGAFPIIGVGGIRSGKDAKDKLEAGASLIQIYSGMVYEGPKLVKRIKQALI
jgi:dihydroorotate dehydrogenase